MSEQFKALVYYHANCADGFGAAFAAWLQLKDNAEYIPVKYGEQVLPIDVLGRTVYILDFSFDADTMDTIFANASRVVWLDHHKTAFEMWLEGGMENGTVVDGKYHAQHPETLSEIVLDNNRSGAKIAWQHFHGAAPVPVMFEHIDDYDRWVFQHQGTKEFNKAIWSLTPWSFEQWEQLWSQDAMKELYVAGEAILRAHDQNVKAVAKNPSSCMINYLVDDGDQGLSHEGLVVNCPTHLTSDVGHELANQSGSYGLLWTLDKDGKTAQCSLRSNGDYDVSRIAKKFGGGGHKNAAGFKVSIRELLRWYQS